MWRKYTPVRCAFPEVSAHSIRGQSVTPMIWVRRTLMVPKEPRTTTALVESAELRGRATSRWSAR